MRLEFAKMSGAGNDFIVLDNMDSSLDAVIAPELIKSLCTRGLSIGADGLLELRCDPDYPFRMKYYNNDGNSAEMCGNGGRCIAAFAASKGIVPSDGLFYFRSDAGIHSAEITGEDSSRIWMTEPLIHYLDRSFDIGSHNFKLSYINTGVPHAVVMIDGSEALSFSEIAPKIREHHLFGSAGVNVDFAVITGDSKLSMRTWERGIEGETLACGTGAAAAAICAESVYGMDFPIDVKVKSGRILQVGRSSNGMWLSGEARTAYTGILHLTEGLTISK